MSTGQAIGTAVGAAAGFMLGGPAGALKGAQIGYMAGSLLDPPKGPTQEGPRLSDTSQQTSTYGATIPRVYGTIGVLGNIFWLENNKLKEVVKKKKSGGKGGGSSATVKTYTYYGTFAVGLCEGPIAGVRRIWVGPDLVYDAGSGDLESVIASNQKSSKFSIYLGGADQQPDPRMQAEMGVANCSAFRGLAYVVVKDLLLTKYGNSIQGASIKVEVVKNPAWEANTLVDVAPYAPTAMTWESGAAFRDDFTGLSYLSRRALLSVEESDLRMGSSGPGLTYATQYNILNEWPRGLVSYDGEMWAGVQTNDYTDANRMIRLRDGFYAEIDYDTLFRSISPKAGYPDVFHILYIPSGSSGALFSQVGLINVTASGGILSGPGMSATAGYRINTCGDMIHEFTAFNHGITVRTYTDNFALAEQYSATVTGAALNTVNGPFSSQGIGTQSCMRDGVFYLCQEVIGGYRVISCDSDGLIDDYVVTATVSTGELYAFYMVSDSAGYIVNEGRVIQFTHYAHGSQPLAQILASECDLTGLLSPTDIDVSAITDSVAGYRVSSTGSVRSAIDPLQGVFPFDVIQSGYKLKFKPRGGISVASIDIGDLGVDEQLRQSREMDSQLPRKLFAKYLDSSRNYDVNEQAWERPGTDSVNTRTLDLPIVLGASQTLQVVERLGYLYWLERTDFGPFTLPPIFGWIEPSDVVTLHAGYADYEIRLTTVNYQSDGSLECTAKPNNAAVYQSLAASNEAEDNAVVPLAGTSKYLLLDIPVVDDTLQNARGFTAVMTGETNGWPGGVIFSTLDGGQTWQDLQAFAGKCTMGTAKTALTVNSGLLIQYGDSLIVTLTTGTLSSITEAQMLAGLNYAAYGVDGRWEIIRFTTATLGSDGNYTLRGLVRGDRGTEWATGLHAIGDSFVLLDDPDGAFIGIASGLIGVEREYRGITSGDDIDADTSRAFTYQGINLECLNPVSGVASRDGSGNLSATFSRRSRLSGSWWANGVQAPVGETAESYEIDVMNGAAIVRTITVTSPAFSYSAASQTTDFGSAQSSISFRIYQLSESVGRGYAYTVTM